MARTTRISQPSNPSGLSYGLTTMTMFMAGLVLVESFNLNLLAHQPHACSRRQHDARTAFRATTFRGKGCHACRASSTSNSEGVSSPSVRRRTASGDTLAQRQQQQSNRCVTTRTTTASASVRHSGELASRKLAARAQSNKGTRSSSSSSIAGSTGNSLGRERGKEGRHRRERRTEERVRVSAGLGHAPMSRAQAVSAFAAAGAAVLVVGRGGLANAATEV